MSGQVCVIDGQGGGLGASVIRAIREAHGDRFGIVALGTNAIATGQMLKAGADRGATGENAIIFSAPRADVIVGALAIGWPNAMMGEVTPRMAEAVMSSTALKILLPLATEGVVIAGLSNAPLPQLVKTVVQETLDGLL